MLKIEVVIFAEWFLSVFLSNALLKLKRHAHKKSPFTACSSKRIEHVIERMCLWWCIECAFLSLWSLFRSIKLRQCVQKAVTAMPISLLSPIVWFAFFWPVSKCCALVATMLFTFHHCGHGPERIRKTILRFWRYCAFSLRLHPVAANIKCQTLREREDSISVRFPLWKFPMLSDFISPRTWRDKFTHALKSL